ncbi:MAG: polyprenyl synthetase family protein [Spirochaetes bacterium]|nr:polyprenyl synthetase family protein [Spirochaetota bacterium]
MKFIEREIKKLKIEEELRSLLFIKNTKKYSIEWGMNYITFSPSKRIRPLLLLESNLIFSSIDKDSYILASAIELIHTYSLVHDDLPCMDNDDIRRGVKTLHKMKDEAYALLVGDALLTRGFGILSKYSKKDILPQIIELFHKKAGYAGMIYGQILDMEGEGKNLEIEAINEINKHKTGALFELVLIIGAMNGKANYDDLENIKKLGTAIGYIFQLKDDVLDIIGDDKILGKKTRSDEKNKKSSIPLIIGVKESEKLLLKYKNLAIGYIENLSSNKDFFYRLIDFIIERTY